MNQKAAGTLAGFTILSLSSLALWDIGALALLFIPIPFAFTASISFNGFRKESLAGLVALPLAVLGSKFMVIALMLALGCPWVSYQAKNIYNTNNEFYTLFKAPLVAVTLLGILISGTVIYAYHTDPGVRDRVVEEAVESSIKFSSISGGAMGSAQDRQIEFAKELARAVVISTQAVVYSELQDSGVLMTPEQASVIDKGFSEAANKVPLEMEAQLVARSDSISAEDLKTLVEEQIRPLLVPSQWLYLATFFTVMSVVWVVQIPFGLMCALYGKFVFRRAPFRGE